MKSGTIENAGPLQPRHEHDLRASARLVTLLQPEMRSRQDEEEARKGDEHRERLAEAPFVEPPIDAPAEPRPASKRRQARDEERERRAVDAGTAEADERQRMSEENEGLVDGARHLLRPTPQLRPKRRQHAGISGKAAEHAAREADRGVDRLPPPGAARRAR